MRCSYFTFVIAAALGSCASSTLTFPTPVAAVQTLLESAEQPAMAEQLLGAGGFDVLRSGDDVADRDDLAVVRELIAQKLAFDEVDDDRCIALLGDDGWPLPIPLVRAGDGWRFDVEAGKDEILNRRIGRNELSTIATLRECVEAQLEYASVGRDGNPPRFAGKWSSSQGAHDGLYWPVSPDGAVSPLGPLVAAADASGYRRTVTEAPVPYHGYLYRMLTAQGPSAPGGARNYVDASGRLREGFGFLAWPVSYGNSGVMSFQVNQQGIVFERDLGDDTAAMVARINSYDPALEWCPVRL